MWWMMRMIPSGWSPRCWVFDRSDFQIERGMKFYHSYSLFLFCLPTIKIQKKKLKRQIPFNRNFISNTFVFNHACLSQAVNSFIHPPSSLYLSRVTSYDLGALAEKFQRKTESTPYRHIPRPSNVKFPLVQGSKNFLDFLLFHSPAPRLITPNIYPSPPIPNSLSTYAEINSWSREGRSNIFSPTDAGAEAMRVFGGQHTFDWDRAWLRKCSPPTPIYFILFCRPKNLDAMFFFITYVFFVIFRVPFAPADFFLTFFSVWDFTLIDWTWHEVEEGWRAIAII